MDLPFGVAPFALASQYVVLAIFSIVNRNTLRSDRNGLHL
jgi:hypothetical protein